MWLPEIGWEFVAKHDDKHRSFGREYEIALLHEMVFRRNRSHKNAAAISVLPAALATTQYVSPSSSGSSLVNAAPGEARICTNHSNRDRGTELPAGLYPIQLSKTAPLVVATDLMAQAGCHSTSTPAHSSS
jgi:hypothetical protein